MEIAGERERERKSLLRIKRKEKILIVTKSKGRVNNKSKLLSKVSVDTFSRKGEIDEGWRTGITLTEVGRVNAVFLDSIVIKNKIFEWE